MQVQGILITSLEWHKEIQGHVEVLSNGGKKVLKVTYEIHSEVVVGDGFISFVDENRIMRHLFLNTSDWLIEVNTEKTPGDKSEVY